MAVHDFDIAGHRPLYSVTKSAGTLLLQQIAKDTPSECMQVISYHPGAIWTDTSRNSGIKADAAEWDNGNYTDIDIRLTPAELTDLICLVSLPGHFALWASSDEAEFLHGRFVWASWDVNELSSGELRVRIDTDPNYLKIGIKGL
jgi:NAD(P)-dependent dehydrogenase (short-subunit alcohol dehydrogenase family)